MPHEPAVARPARVYWCKIFEFCKLLFLYDNNQSPRQSKTLNRQYRPNEQSAISVDTNHSLNVIRWIVDFITLCPVATSRITQASASIGSIKFTNQSTNDIQVANIEYEVPNVRHS
jgi:hypothetical protein